MGANAQTSVPLFSSGEVLTAANQNLSAGTGVPVFATTVTRDAAFGGAGEKVLAEGQLAYIEASDVVQYYNGTSWETVGPATAGGLVFINNTAFTTATSVSLPTNTFTSTYTNYRVIFTLTASTSTGNITGRVRTSGTDNSSGQYFQMSTGIDNGGNLKNQANSGSTSFTLGNQGNSSYPASNIVLDFFRPNVNAYLKAMSGSLTFFDGVSIYVGRALNMLFDNNNVALQIDSFSFISSTASSMTGNVRVYGYADS